MKLVTMLLFVLILQPINTLQAHAVITETSLKVDNIPANQLKKVELQFNSQIELGLSRVFLVSQGDKQMSLGFSAGKQAGQLVIEIPPLTAGKYALRINVFAADGHLTEELVRFSVTP